MGNSQKYIDELYNKPSGYKFNDSEVETIVNHLKKNKHNYRGRYAFYRSNSVNNFKLVFIIDQCFNSMRRSGVENHWEFVCDRPLTNLELTELAQNFGCHNKRFIVYYYKDIDFMIEEDLKYNVETPTSFVNESISRGYKIN